MVAIAAAKRAPQRAAALLAAMPQEHERALGNWQAELAEWPALFMSAHGSLHALAEACAGLEVDAGRMRANIDAQRGSVFAEAAAAAFVPALGKARAHALLAALAAQSASEGESLKALALRAIDADPALAAVDRHRVEAAFDIDAAARHAGALAAEQLDALLRLEEERQGRSP
jgi:3-carboxy-cis,cis-muconate cycloisomerase